MTDEIIGLNRICEMLVNKSTDYGREGFRYHEMEMLNQSIEINPNSTNALSRIAIIYECDNNDFDKAEQVYLKMLEIEPDEISTLYNIADLYSKMCNYESMKKYYLLAGEKGDVESFIKLAVYYNNQEDHKECLNYLLRTLEIGEINNDLFLNILDNFNPITLFVILKEITNDVKNLKEFIQFLNEIRDVIIYKNKIRLFNRFQNMQDCGICLENKLNIDLHCAHEICIDCYPKIYKTNCPFCRLPASSMFHTIQRENSFDDSESSDEDSDSETDEEEEEEDNFLDSIDL
jgi:tetratricopeptide (TPR) repeat protein